MPYLNEHACRLAPPGNFQEGSFRRLSLEHNGKTYHPIVGKRKDGKSATQAYRYPKKTWMASAAKEHCESHGGTFHAAAGGTAQTAETDFTKPENNPLIP